MAVETDLLHKCLDIAKYLVKTEMQANLSINFGKDFTFNFSMNESNNKKHSPSQIKRNFERKAQYLSSKNVQKEQVENKGVEVQTDNNPRHVCKSTQTPYLTYKDVGVSCGRVVSDKATGNIEKFVGNDIENGEMFGSKPIKSIFDERIVIKPTKPIFDEELMQLQQASYKCHLCKLRFVTKRELMMHLKCDHNGESMKFMCEECDETWNHEVMLNSHKQENHSIYICARCNAHFKGKQNLDEHFRLKHRAF